MPLHATTNNNHVDNNYYCKCNGTVALSKHRSSRSSFYYSQPATTAHPNLRGVPYAPPPNLV
eukprot:scaffold10032_cov90-Alexandrium_tamarense.AAC.1